MASSSSSFARRIAVVGMGAWGSALALHCARAGHTIVGWHRDDEFVAKANSSRSIEVAGVATPLPATLTLTSKIEDLGQTDFTIVALPARAWGEVVPKLTSHRIVSATKGIEKGSSLTPLSYAAKHLKIAAESLAVISGPSFASDLTAERPISIVAGSTSEQFAQLIASALSTSTLRVYSSTDPLGVELGGILKNVIAIAAGVSDSLGYGPSARAALITRGLVEMTCVATALGADSKTLYGLSGLGDLMMTATEDQSRNRMVGLKLGKGSTLPEVIASLGATAEGVSSAPLVQEIARKKGVETPITDEVVKLLRGEIQATDLAKRLMTRPLKREF